MCGLSDTKEDAMQKSVMLIAFLLPGVLVAYWMIADWLKERSLRRRWAAQPLLSKAMKRAVRMQAANQKKSLSH